MTRVLGKAPAAQPLSLIQMLKRHRLQLLGGAVFLLATNVVFFVLPRLVNVAISLVEGTGVRKELLSSRFQGLDIKAVVLMICGLAALGAVVRTISRRMMFNVGRDVERDVRRTVFSHLETMSPRFFMNHSVGELMNYLSMDANNIRMLAGFMLLNVLNILFIFGLTVPILFSIDWLVATAALSPFPMVMISGQMFASAMFQKVRVYQSALGQLTSHVQENLGGAQVVRIFGQQHLEEERFQKTNDQAYRAALNLARVRIVMFPFTRLVAGLGVALTLLVGGRAVVLGHMSLGDFVEVNARLLQLAWPAMSIGFVISIYNRGQASITRINEILNVQPTIVDGALPLTTIDRIEAKGLRIVSESRAEPLLNDVHFRFDQPKVIGVVGPSGGGKTTFARALMHEVEIERGQLLVNGLDINDLSLTTLRQKIAHVPSEPFLFSISIRDNITIARPDASAADVWKIVERVGLASDVERMPDGIQTIIGERGITLSGGQRQRLAIARALVAKPDVLILDDSLSAVDAETERHITNYLQKESTVKIMIIISHRLSAVQDANEILVFDRGQIVARGTHDRLLEHSPLYRALWGIEKLERRLEVKN